uniref:Uncharacterized protein n=1 Tax=Panagrolaimus sp. PS1159 TaxID=55785 RepID=A0AC35FSZ8_9BILA
MDTFYTIATNRRFDCLPIISANGTEPVRRISEGLTTVIEIPQSAHDYKELLSIVAKKCGCIRMVLRRKPTRMNAKSCLISIKPVGTFVAVQKLRAMLEVKPRTNETDLQKRSEMIFEEVYKRLVFYSKPENSIDDPFIDFDE